MSEKLGNEVCLLCGHEGGDGGRDYSDGDWYCQICLDTSTEAPINVY